jgi:hypothetical protein
MPKQTSTFWQLPWNKLLQQIPWRGMDCIAPPLRVEVEDEPAPMIISTPIPVDLPAKPMTISFGKLLSQIPWQGTSMAIPQNRLKGVVS